MPDRRVIGGLLGIAAPPELEGARCAPSPRKRFPPPDAWFAEQGTPSGRARVLDVPGAGCLYRVGAGVLSGTGPQGRRRGELYRCKWLSWN